MSVLVSSSTAAWSTSGSASGGGLNPRRSRLTTLRLKPLDTEATMATGDAALLSRDGVCAHGGHSSA